MFDTAVGDAEWARCCISQLIAGSISFTSSGGTALVYGQQTRCLERLRLLLLESGARIERLLQEKMPLSLPLPFQFAPFVHGEFCLDESFPALARSHSWNQ